MMSATLTNWTQHFDLAREQTRMAQSQVDFIIGGDEAYPRLLREISDPPIALYRKGRYDFSQPCIDCRFPKHDALWNGDGKKNWCRAGAIGFLRGERFVAWDRYGGA